MQYLDDMILEREKANDALREELTKYVGWCQMLDQSQVSIFIFQSLSSMSKGAISLAIIVLVQCTWSFDQATKDPVPGTRGLARVAYHHPRIMEVRK